MGSGGHALSAATEPRCGRSRTLYKTRIGMTRKSWRTLALLAACATATPSTTLAVTTVWNPVANGVMPPDSGDFLDGANWTQGIATGDKAVLNVPGSATSVLSGAIELLHLSSGDDGTGGTLILADGAELTTTNWSAAGYNNSAIVTVEEGATATFQSHLWIAHTHMATPVDYEAKFIMNGGSVTVEGAMGIGFELPDPDAPDAPDVTVTASIELNAGTLHVGTNFYFDRADLNGTVDIREAVWTIAGDRTDAANNSIALGTLTAYGGEGTVEVSFDGGTNLTTITGTPPPDDPLTIIEFTFDDQTGATEITWNSVQDESYRIAYTTDLADWTKELDDAYPGDAGDTTTYAFNRSDLGADAIAGTVAFRIEKMDE